MPSPVNTIRAPLYLLLLGGCTVGPNYQPPPVPAAARLTETPLPTATMAANTPGGAAQIFDSGRDIPGDWWALFQSPQISNLVTRALAANPDITAAKATLQEARENLRAEQGTQYPQITASTSTERQRESLAAVGFGTGSETFSVTNASLNISYTLDAFGGTRRQLEQLGAQADYENFELEATDLTLVANVVNEAITEASLRAQIDTTTRIIAEYDQALTVIRHRFTLGGVSEVDVLQEQSLRDSEAATLPALRKQLEQARNQLAVYLGGTPGQSMPPPLDLDSLTLPRELPVSLPSALVAQRPDIQAYAALLHAATANVGIATANMLPQITLTGSYGRDGTDYANLFNPGGIVWSVANSLTQPVFEGGTLRARRRAAQAAAEVAAAQYSSTANSAFKDVANALVAIERDAETLAADQAAQATASENLAVARAQYDSGGGTYLNVLTAEQSDQTARLSLISARAARFTDTVALFQALGGGWWHRADVAPQPVHFAGVFP